MMKKFSKGDTLIEVMVAVSIFAMLMVGALTLMNAGVTKAQTTLQHTMARNAVDTQAEALRFLNDAYISQYPNVKEGEGNAGKWMTITKDPAVSASSINECRKEFTQANVFVIDPLTMSKKKAIQSAEVFPRLLYSETREDSNKIDSKTSMYVGSEGVWIEVIKPDKKVNYNDFHIRACWYPAGSNVPSTIGTIVRLYEPEN